MNVMRGGRGGALQDLTITLQSREKGGGGIERCPQLIPKTEKTGVAKIPEKITLMTQPGKGGGGTSSPSIPSGIEKKREGLKYF